VRSTIAFRAFGDDVVPGFLQGHTITTTGAPAPRSGDTATWGGARMIIWGGSGACCNNWFNVGFAYTP